MESSNQFAEIIFNLFFCIVIITYAGFNIDYYNKIKDKPSQAISSKESDSMFYVSIAIIAFTSIIFVYYLYRAFTYADKKTQLFVDSKSQPRYTLDRFNLEQEERNPQFFNQSVKDLRNIKQSYQEPPLYRQRQNIGGTGF